MQKELFNRKYKVAWHVIFWCLGVLLLTSIFYLYGENISLQLFLKSIIINLFFSVGVYINLYYLIPKFLKQKNYIFYFFWLILLLSLISLALQVIFLYPLHSFTSLYSDNHTFNPNLHSAYFFSSLSYVAVSTFIKLIKDWFTLQDLNLKLATIEKQKLEAELKTLKGQLNPHFLFNSLNNIYSLALIQSDKVPGLIIKLSDLMRHIIYDSRENYISLDKEIDFVNNFIELQKIRTSEKTKITYTIKGKIPNARIAPLLFEPFIDNAFKHGLPGSTENDFISIIFDFEKEGQLLFRIENNFELYAHSSKQHSGIGLENVKKRLELLYKPNEYELMIEKRERLFSVGLNLKLK